MTLPRSSVIVCSRNRHRYLLETVESVLRGRERPTEIVVVDQSDEPHAELAEMGLRDGCAIRYLHNAERREPGPQRGDAGRRHRAVDLHR
jgi:glycosyltransferase involved in cell wall biosynthesis